MLPILKVFRAEVGESGLCDDPEVMRGPDGFVFVFVCDVDLVFGLLADDGGCVLIWNVGGLIASGERYVTLGFRREVDVLDVVDSVDGLCFIELSYVCAVGPGRSVLSRGIIHREPGTVTSVGSVSTFIMMYSRTSMCRLERMMCPICS